MSTEALLAAAYAGLLLVTALGLDILARDTHNRSVRYRTNGFTFVAAIDAWECPEGEQLRRATVDHTARVVRYRARAAVCNACPAKGRCTDSDAGREIVHPVDPWPHSEAGRFHRSFSVVLVSIAGLICIVALLRSSSLAEVALLAALGGISILIAVGLASKLLATPSGFPAPDPRV